jgi:hypothetical protein
VAAARVPTIIFGYIWNGCVNWLFFGPRLDIQVLRQQSNSVPGTVTFFCPLTLWYLSESSLFLPIFLFIACHEKCAGGPTNI